MGITEDDAIAWLQFRQIKTAWKPSTYPEEPGWRTGLARPTKQLRLTVPQKSVASLLRLIAMEAWESYPKRRVGGLADKIWGFFSQEELRELYSMASDQDS